MNVKGSLMDPEVMQNLEFLRSKDNSIRCKGFLNDLHTSQHLFFLQSATDDLNAKREAVHSVRIVKAMKIPRNIVQVKVFLGGVEIVGKRVDGLIDERDRDATSRVIKLERRKAIRRQRHLEVNNGKTNEVIDETSRGGDKSGLARGISRNRGRRDRKSQNEVDTVLIQTPVPLSEIRILLDEQLVLRLDRRALSESIKEGGPIVVPPSRRRIFPEHPSHEVPNETRKVLKEVSGSHSLIN